MSKSCPIIEIDDAPEIINTQPNHEEWLKLHALADKFREIYGLEKYPAARQISFFMQLPDSNETIKVHIYTERLKAILIEADFLSDRLSNLHELYRYNYDIPQDISRHYLRVAFVNKNKLSKEELALREELELPSLGKKRLHHLSITEKLPGLPLVPIDQSHVSLVELILSFAANSFNDRSLNSNWNGQTPLFTLAPGEDSQLVKSWKKSPFHLPDLADYHHLPVLEKEEATELSLSPTTWTLLCEFVPVDCPCPQGFFNPLLLRYLHHNTKESNDEINLTTFKQELIKDLSDLPEAIAAHFHKTLSESTDQPTHILTTSPLIYHALKDTFSKSKTQLIFANNTDDAPYTSLDDFYEFLHTSEEDIYQSLGYPLITKTKAVLHIKLNDVRPAVTRTIEVAGNTSLSDLHYDIQSVMGWDNDHLHEFYIDNTDQTVHFSDEELSLDKEQFIKPSCATTINSLYQTGRKTLNYLYDFGSNWKHTITIRSLTPTDAPPKSPVIINSKGKCPEDY